MTVWNRVEGGNTVINLFLDRIFKGPQEIVPGSLYADNKQQKLTCLMHSSFCSHDELQWHFSISISIIWSAWHDQQPSWFVILVIVHRSFWQQLSCRNLTWPAKDWHQTGANVFVFISAQKHICMWTCCLCLLQWSDNKRDLWKAFER